MNDTKVFVTGTTRAGTTVFRLMLGCHPQLVDAGEFEWVFRPGSSPEGPTTDEELDDYRVWIQEQRWFRYTGLSLEPDLDYAQIVESILDQRRRRIDAQKPIVVAVAHGDYEHVRRRFPDARFIHLSRDPRDVIMSWIRFGWIGNEWAGARWWRDLQNEWRDTRARIPSERRMELRFEDLIGDAEAALRAVADFIGVPYDAAMFNFHESSTYDPVDPKQAFKWKRKMPAAAVRTIEAELGPELEAWGYERTLPDTGPTPAWRARLLSVDNAVKVQRAKIDRFGGLLWAKELIGRRAGLRELQRRASLQMDDIIQRSVK